MIPYQLYTRYVHALIGAMYSTHRGAKAHHVHAWEFLAKQAALETCMYTAHEGVLGI